MTSLFDDIDTWLQQQVSIKEHPIHQSILNMNAQVRSAQFMYKEDVPTVLAVCCSCICNWISSFFFLIARIESL